MKTYKKNRIFIILSGIAVLYVGMIVFFSFVDPSVARNYFELNNINANNFSGLLFAWDNVYETISHVYPGILKLFMLTTLSLSLYGWFVLSKGKNIIEVFLLFIVYLIPRPEEYWGKVQDKSTFNPLPFSVVRVVRKSSTASEQEFVTETITDLFGKYRLNFTKENGYEYFLIVNLQNYKAYSKEVSNREAKLISIYDDIFLEPLNTNLSFRSKFLNSLKTHMNTNISTYLYLASLLSLLVTIRSLLLYNAPFGNYVELTQYIIAVVINTKRIFTLQNSSIGKVMLYNKKKVLANINVQLKKDGKVLDKKISNKYGIITFNVSPGAYELELLESDYKLVDSNTSEKVIISEKGFLRNNIILEESNSKIGQVNANLSMMNPFN